MQIFSQYQIFVFFLFLGHFAVILPTFCDFSLHLALHRFCFHPQKIPPPRHLHLEKILGLPDLLYHGPTCDAQRQFYSILQTEKSKFLPQIYSIPDGVTPSDRGPDIGHSDPLFLSTTHSCSLLIPSIALHLARCVPELIVQGQALYIYLAIGE
jgi:hypothetical protein